MLKKLLLKHKSCELNENKKKSVEEPGSIFKKGNSTDNQMRN